MTGKAHPLQRLCVLILAMKLQLQGFEVELSSRHAVVVSVTAFVTWKLFSMMVNKRSLAHVPGPKRSSWWKGNFDQFLNRDGWSWHADLYRKYGGAVRVEMPFGEQFLYVSDPLALQHICNKDQHAYEETEMFLLQFHLLFGKCLLSCLGDEHKKQRKMLNPIFAPKHMRELYPVFQPIAEEVKAIIESEVLAGKEHVDIMNWTSRAALEYVGRGGLGYNFDALNKNEQRNEYSEAIKTLTPLLFRLAFLRMFVPWLVKLGPPAFRRWLIDLVPSGPIREITDVVDTIERSTTGIYNNKKEAIKKGEISTQVGQGKDIITVLMKGYDSKNEKVEAHKLPEHEMLAHMSSFIIAGHETTSSGMSNLFYVLAQHPEVQKKLRAEVRKAREDNHGDLDYETLMALPYLDAVVRETMRVFPPAPMLDRVANQDVILPLQFPETSADGKAELKEILVKKGTNIFISIIGSNRNKKVWGEDAEEWRPERWLEAQPNLAEGAKFPGVYNQMMTFMGGQRACIGFKFAEMELKLVLATLTERFAFAPGPEIFWSMGNVQLPFLKSEESSAIQMPLKVTIAE